MRINLIVTNRGRDAHLPAFLHYLGAANAAGRFDVALYLVEPAGSPLAPTPPLAPGLRLGRVAGPADPDGRFNKARLLNAGLAAMRPGWDWCGVLDIDMVYGPTLFDTVSRVISGYVVMTGGSLSPAQTAEVLGRRPLYAELAAWDSPPFTSPSQIAFTPAWLARFREVFARQTLFDERFVGWGHEDTVPDVAAGLLARARLGTRATIERLWLHLDHPRQADRAQADRNLALAVALHAELRARLRAYLRRHGPPRPALPSLERGAAFLQAGRPAEAEPHLRAALALEPASSDIAQLLAVALGQRGAHAEAEALLRAAVSRDPADWELRLNLGEVLRRQGRRAEARAAFVEALGLNPYFPEAYYNLGTLCRQEGRQGEALEYLGQAVRMRPGYAAAHYNLGNTLRELGHLDEARGAYEAALRAQPGYAEAHLNLGAVCQELEQTAAAEAHYRQAAGLRPGLAAAHRNLWQLYEGQGRLDEARAAGGRALSLEPDDELLRLSLETMLPPIASSLAAVDAARAAVAAAIARRPDGVRLERGRVGESGGAPPFALIYHGRDDRALKEAYAALFAGAFPDAPPEPAPGPPRAGFVVTAGHEGVFLKCMAGVIEALPAPLAPVVVCGSARAARSIRAAIGRSDLSVVALPPRLDAAAAALRGLRLHLLYYWEIGTDSLNYFLPFCRPAPIQCAGWGWPITSGIPAVDYFLSSAALEPPGAAAHYGERLVALPSLPARYMRPPAPPVAPPRAHYGLDEADHVYLCAQNLRKVHPDFDPLLAAILRRDPRAVAVFLADKAPVLGEQLLARLRAAMPDVAARLRLLPRLDEAGYLGLMACADVVLDTPHYGGGANTCYDAAAAGVPVVTLPGAFQRGRWAAAVAAALGVPDGVAANAEEYVARALALGEDRGYRAAVAARIVDAAPGLFMRDEPARELGTFLLETIEGAGA